MRSARNSLILMWRFLALSFSAGSRHWNGRSLRQNPPRARSLASDLDEKCASLGIKRLMGRCQMACGAMDKRLVRKVRSVHAGLEMWTLLDLFQALARRLLMFSCLPNG